MLPKDFTIIACFLSMIIFVSGTKHQELQVAAVANVTELPVPASLVADGNTSTEFSHGTVVSYAFPHASRLPVSQRVQGMVLKPSHRHDRGQQRIQ